MDPYRGFKFRLKIDNEYVVGLSKCGALKKSTEVVEFREGGDPSHSRKMPGLTKYEPITLEAGITFDSTFEDWANLVNNFKGDSSMSLAGFRKEFITLDVFNLQDVKIKSYVIYRPWVSEYQALPELNASENGVMIQTLTIQNEGWESDGVKEMAET